LVHQLASIDEVAKVLQISSTFCHASFFIFGISRRIVHQDTEGKLHFIFAYCFTQLEVVSIIIFFPHHVSSFSCFSKLRMLETNFISSEKRNSQFKYPQAVSLHSSSFSCSNISLLRNFVLDLKGFFKSPPKMNQVIGELQS
jgi:hypothetical protein